MSTASKFFYNHASQKSALAAETTVALLFLTGAKELFWYLEQPQDKVRAWRRETSEEELDEEL